MRERRFVILHPDGVAQIWGVINDEPPLHITSHFIARGTRYAGARLVGLNDRAAFYAPDESQ